MNNAQRKALAQLVEKTYQRLIGEAKDKEGLLVKEITEKVKVELGIDTIDTQIEALKKQIENLEDKKKKLGFGYYELVEGSKAKLLIDTRTRQESMEMVGLEKELTERLAGLWTAQTIDEAKALLKGIVK